MKTKLLYALTVKILFLMPNVTLGQAPDLRTAANFVLFSTNGAVSNSGISQLTGNVGTNKGSNTFFGNVNGVMHAQDSASAQCSTDLLKAYNQLDSTTATFFPSSLLGNGDTLIEGVYSISGAATLNSVLYLNAKGNASAVFIFKIQGSLSTSASSKIKLINGALACNVFWKVEGLVSMASGTTMRGTIIANNAAINMNTGDTLEGRALSTTGTITVYGVMAYTPVGCGRPTLTGPYAPSLASTANYGIFSSSGAVTNSGISHITGDVGTNVGLTIGFDSLLVKGTIHLKPDTSTAKCAADLTKVYNYLNTLPYDIELLNPAQFGRNLVLTPHTYRMNAAPTFTDTLYLNAQGNTNAVFVIQIKGALSTSTYSKVLLINGTQAKNVYWNIDGAVSINENSVFNGTIICNGGAITLKTGVTLNGRALTTVGIITTFAITTTMFSDSVTTPTITGTTPHSICGPGTVILGATASAGTINWYSKPTGGSSLHSGTSYTTPSISVNDTFYVDATLGNITTASRTAVIATVTTIPTITGTTPQSICGTGTVTLGAAASAGTINWYANLTGSSSLHTGTSYTTPNISINDTLFVDATLLNCTTASRTAVIATINTIPTITGTTPGSVSGSGTVTLLATASAGTINWYANPIGGSALGSGTSYTTPIISMNDTLYVDATLLNCTTASRTAVIATVTTTTGVISIASKANETVTFYPNPFTTTINLIINDASQINNCEFSMYNMLGEEVMYKMITTQSTTLQTSNLHSGIYFYKVNINNKTIQSGKLISR